MAMSETAASDNTDRTRRVPLRPAATVMRLARLGAFHQTRLSFTRATLRALKRAGARLSRPRFEIGPDAVGHAVYRVAFGEQVYSLICFSHDLDPADRTDRVIAQAWDATFVLHDGEADDETIARLADAAPFQEAGRYEPSDLVLSRANRSSRLFDHVVSRLSEGRQPDPAQLGQVGYLMRTTAVYGNGKFGLADRARIADREIMCGPFRPEMLTVWLIRAFTADLAEHLAATRAPGSAVRLEPGLRRMLGVGNATGLGLGPFIVRHPALFGRWIEAREDALARVRALPQSSPETRAAFCRALARARAEIGAWHVADQRQMERIEGLRRDLAKLAAQVGDGALSLASPWDELTSYGEKNFSIEGQEFLVSLILEPHGHLIDDLADAMAVDEDDEFHIDGGMRLDTLIAAIERDYAWALKVDYGAPAANARFWYVSENKLEPRLGERALEPGSEREQPLAVGRDIAALYREAKVAAPSTHVADFLLASPEHRHTVRRIQIAGRHAYAEIQDNLIGADLMPLDLLRCKLAFFGATRFDPKSDRWLRINLFQNAPYPDEFESAEADDWAFAATAGEA